MSQEDRSFLRMINKARNIAIISHQTPDVDAFASSFALREIIRKFHSTASLAKITRKKVDIFLDYTALPSSLNIFLQKAPEKLGYLNPKRPMKQYCLAIALDCASAERMGKYLSVFQNAKSTINIDHHSTNTQFAIKNYVFEASSTCEALYNMMPLKQKKESKKYIWSLLYAGILTDTNNLKNNADFASTEKALLEIKQKLGSGLAKTIRANFFENHSPAKDELQAEAYSRKNRKYFQDNKLCVITLNKNAFKKTRAEAEDAEGLVDEALYRKDVLISALILEKDKRKLYIKLRGKQGVDVSYLAKEFGGGGHEQQAAFQFEGSVRKLKKMFLPKAKNFAQGFSVEYDLKCPEIFK